VDKEIGKLVDNYLSEKSEEKPFSVPVSGKVYDREELVNLIEASLEGWWTEGHWTAEFEKKISEFLGIKYVHSCNSGSSANLLAFSALCSPSLKERQIKKGDEVITLAAGFPTTINAIFQNGCVPVFIDIDIETYDVDVSQLEKAYSDKTKAVMIAHTLGNPFNIKAVKEFCDKHNLWLIEDNCDALGSKYGGKYTGTFGDIATLSFYPAHHITTAEGGAVLTNDLKLSKIVRSLRDWGRHCWCPTGKDNTCKNRYNWKLGDLPEGYDHKYIYGELGYNLKLSDLHAAIGVAQMDKLPEFVKKRRENFEYLHKNLEKFSEYFILPQATEGSEPSWFGFLITIKDSHINRESLLQYLQDKKIGTRLLFGGNMTKQPYFIDNKELNYRIVGGLKNTDTITSNTFWIGVYPGLEKKHLDYITSTIGEFLYR
jgi:CDP-6-deoxy-D-xylo-4-hexulose-3-dehydrase